MRHIFPLAVLAAIVTAACGGGELTVVQPARDEIRHKFTPDKAASYQLPFSISGGFLPFASSIEGCPDWVSLLPDHGVLAGTAPAEEAGKTFFCTYRVTEADPGFRPQRSVSYGLRLVVEPPDSLALLRDAPKDINLSVGMFDSNELPQAQGGVPPYTYSFTCAGDQLPSGTGFAPETRIFAGIPDAPFRDSCTYSVRDSAQPPAIVSRAVEVNVAGLVTEPLKLPDQVVPGNVLRLRVGERTRITFRPAADGAPPYTYDLQCPGLDSGTLPGGLGFGPETRVLSGAPVAAYRGPDCTYQVTDSSSPPESAARSVAIIIDPNRAKWRFTDRSLAQQDQLLNRDNDSNPQLVHQLPVADIEGGTQPDNANPVYSLVINRPAALTFNSDPDAHQLEYVHPESEKDPEYDKTFTYRYQVLFGNTVDDTLCIDVSFRDEDEDNEDDRLIASVRIRDDAHWDGEMWRCPAAHLQPMSASRASVSNPVHAVLAPVHARRAVDVAHTAVRDRVRGWSRGQARTLTAIAPALGLASLSGESGGFDYSGTSEALSAGAEFGAESWQAGAVASFVQTGLHYRAGASLAQRGYLAGEHDTEFLSLHPFAAWHASSGGHVWASLGAGLGELRHRDDLGFPSWSRSDVRLLSYAAGASVPVADMLSGELQVEADIESFALKIEGGGSISSSLPTIRGRDYRAGLAWSAPLPGSPSISMAYKHLTGDGADGGSLETEGSFSVAGVFDPRLSLTGSIEAAFGLGENDQDLWGLGAGLRFAPDGLGRGFGLGVETRLRSLTHEQSPSVSIHGEAGYGWGGGPFGTIRPYLGVVGESRRQSVQPTLGVALRETPDSVAKVEFRERPAIDRALMFTLRHRL